MRWEQVPEIPLFSDNTAAFIHDLPGEAIANAAGASDYVRVQVLTPVGVLDRDKQLGVVKELTEIVAAAAGCLWALLGVALAAHGGQPALDPAPLHQGEGSGEDLHSAASCRILLTYNRLHFLRLHRQRTSDHWGIVLCTFDPDFGRQARNIDPAGRTEVEMKNKILRVNRPG